nr:F-box protein At1g53790-like [Aegilops tauschii subsp. strangulata]
MSNQSMATATATFHAPLHLPIVGTTNDGILPLDLLYDLLLRLPDKPLCRFRAVCRAWQSLLCHPDFIAAHDHRHPCQRRAVGVYRYGRTSPSILVLDMDTGLLIKRLCHDGPTHNHGPLSPDRAVCVHSLDMRLRLLDHVTGAVSVLPRPAPPRNCVVVSYSLGRVASTSEYKVLAVVTLVQPRGQVCKILTLTDGQQHWRATGKPLFESRGVAYFLVVDERMDKYAAADWIMGYHLDSEAWRSAAIKGPAGTLDVGLAGLDGRLIVCHDDRRTRVQLWSLVEPDQSLWSMLHRIVMPGHTLARTPLWSRFRAYVEKPLAVLEDGQIVMRMRVKSALQSSFPNTVLRLYDPRTGTSTDAARMMDCHDVSIYTCSMLHSGLGDRTYQW